MKMSFESSQQEQPTNESEELIDRPYTPGRPFSAEDRARLDALADVPDEHIDFSEIPELPEDFFKSTVRGWLPLETHSVTLALDPEVYEWLHREGKQNARAINTILRREMQQMAEHREQVVPEGDFSVRKAS